MTVDELRAQCVNAARGPRASFAGTAVKDVAEELGLLTAEAGAAYEAGFALDRRGYALPVGDPGRLKLHEEAHALYRRMAALVLERLDATEQKATP